MVLQLLAESVRQAREPAHRQARRCPGVIGRAYVAATRGVDDDQACDLASGDGEAKGLRRSSLFKLSPGRLFDGRRFIGSRPGKVGGWLVGGFRLGALREREKAQKECGDLRFASDSAERSRNNVTILVNTSHGTSKFRRVCCSIRGLPRKLVLRGSPHGGVGAKHDLHLRSFCVTERMVRLLRAPKGRQKCPEFPNLAVS